MTTSKAEDKCVVCHKTVYAMEKFSVEGKVFHENCFKCAHCKKKLSPGTYTQLDENYYCIPHYTQLFATKGNYSAFGKEKAPAGAATSPRPPGPPPPPPPMDLTAGAAPANDTGSAHAAALASIASGEHKLKHVSKEERKRKPQSSLVPGDAKPKEKAPSKTAAPTSGAPQKGTPTLQMEPSGKWTVRFFENRRESPVEVNITDMKQSVSISDCRDTVVVVKGKLTNVSVMNSTSVGVMFDDVIATAEVVRCNKVQLQVNGKIAQICIDKTYGCDVYVQSQEGRKVEIITSLADGINVNYMPPNPEVEDPVEFPIPSQFQSVIKGDKMVTTPMSHV